MRRARRGGNLDRGPELPQLHGPPSVRGKATRLEGLRNEARRLNVDACYCGWRTFRLTVGNRDHHGSHSRQCGLS